MANIHKRRSIRKTFIYILVTLMLSVPLMQSCSDMFPELPGEETPVKDNNDNTGGNDGNESEDGGDKKDEGDTEPGTSGSGTSGETGDTTGGDETEGSGSEADKEDTPPSTSGETPSEDEPTPPAIKEIAVLGTDMLFVGSGDRTEIEIPYGWTGYAVLMNDGSNWQSGATENVSYTVEGDEDKALVITSSAITAPEYEAGTNRLIWNNMPKNTGGKCDAYEYARDNATGIIYMFDTALSSEQKEDMGKLLETLYYECGEALPDNSLRNAESTAGTTPRTLYKEDGSRYLFVLFTDFGASMEYTLGVFGTIGQIYGTYPSVDVNAAAFGTSKSSAWQLSSTIVHEYSHFLESYIRMNKTGRPGFGPHLLTEGFADWSAATNTGHTKTEEANYIGLWMEEGNLWHPTMEKSTPYGVSLRLADYGLGCMLWDRIAYEYGDEGVRKILSSCAEDFSGLETVVGRDFGVWYDRSVMDILMAVGADDRSGRDVSYLEDYQLRWVWDTISDYIGASPVGTTTVTMTTTGTKIVRLPDSAYAFTATGADRCILFALENQN